MNRDGLEVVSDEGVVRITLNRPERRNALSEALLADLDEVLSEIAGDSSARVVVIAAKGPVFSSGHDLGEMVGRSGSEYSALFGRCSAVMMKIRRLPQPVVARVQGPALAAGCQLVAASDMAVASETATFSTPGVRIGLFCSTPMVPLMRAVPAKAAMEMLLTGEPISAERALALGLVNRVVKSEHLDVSVAELIGPILKASPRVVREGKAAFYQSLALTEPAAYDRATAAMTAHAQTHDAREGIAAFLQKRPPAWSSE